MQQFNDKQGKGRLLNISNMKEEEAEELFEQNNIPEELKVQCAKELKKQIHRLTKEGDYLEWILAIRSKEGKLIGRMEVTSFDEKVASLKIQIPNANYISKYGIEALEQFIEICKNNHYFVKIELDSNNYIAKSYIRRKSLKSTEIDVA